MRLGEILISMQRLDEVRLHEALDLQQQEKTPRLLGAILLERKWITEQDLIEALGRQYGCLVWQQVPAECMEPALVAQLPVDWARRHQLVPVRFNGHVDVLGTDPRQIALLSELALLLGEEPAMILAPAAEIRRVMDHCYFQQAGRAGEQMRDLVAETARGVVRESGAEDLLRAADHAPVTQMANLILLDAVKQGASDVHLEPFENRLALRYRMDGMLYEQPAPPKQMEEALVARLKVMAHLDLAEKRLPQDGTARVRVGEREIDVRVSLIPVAEGERVVLRLLHRDSSLLPLRDLGMGAALLDPFRTLLQEPNGVILVTGPTGSGKTTTLYAALQELDTAHRNVLTIEDPIEYQLPNIGQMQVKPKIDLTFSRGLRHLLRQDPDVILVGETRDLETAEIMVRASLTGHLVFSTLHTNDAASAIIRLADMGVPPYLLASALRATLAQRLVRRLCPVCRRATRATQAELAAWGRLGSLLAGREIYEAAGCSQCLGGYKGRTGLYELMVINPPLQEAIRQNVPLDEIRRLALANGMRNMAADGVEKILQGQTSIAEVLRAVGGQGLASA